MLKTPEVEKFVGLLRETMAPQIVGQTKAILAKETPWAKEDFVANGFTIEEQQQLEQPIAAYCALGLLTDHLGYEAYDYQLAPREVTEWLGYDLTDLEADEFDPNVEIEFYDFVSGYAEADYMTISELNDSRFTFGQIADLIEYFGLSEEI